MKSSLAKSTRRSRLRRIELAAQRVASSPRLRETKRVLQRRFVAESLGILPEALVARALDEAEIQADAAGFADLFFPELAAEYVRRLTAG